MRTSSRPRRRWNPLSTRPTDAGRSSRSISCARASESAWKTTRRRSAAIKIRIFISCAAARPAKTTRRSRAILRPFPPNRVRRAGGGDWRFFPLLPPRPLSLPPPPARRTPHKARRRTPAGGCCAGKNHTKGAAARRCAPQRAPQKGAAASAGQARAQACSTEAGTPGKSRSVFFRRSA